MPFNLKSRKSTKSLPKFKAPARKACSSDFDDGWNVETRIPKVTMRLAENVTSTLSKDGHWRTEFESKDESKDLLSLQQTHEKLLKDKEMLSQKHKILLDLAKDKIGQLEKLEKERRQLARIVGTDSRNEEC